MKAIGIFVIAIVWVLTGYVFLVDGGMETLHNSVGSLVPDSIGAQPDADNAPGPAGENGSEDAPATERPSRPTKPVIALPGPAARFEWGDDPGHVAQYVDVAFERKGADLMIQSRPRNGTVYRYLFKGGKLHKVQVRQTPGKDRTVDALHGEIMNRMKGKYDHLPDSMRTFWADGFTTLRLSLDRRLGWVQLEYRQQP